MGKINPRTGQDMTEFARMGGRAKKGSKHQSTIDREKILEEIKNGIALKARTLVNVQTMLAVGTVKVFRVDITYKGKKIFRSQPRLVSDDDEIIAALDWKFNDGPSPNGANEYYFVVTKDPHYKALDSLLDRTFGKAKESKEVKVTGLNLKDLHDQANETDQKEV